MIRTMASEYFTRSGQSEKPSTLPPVKDGPGKGQRTVNISV